MSNNCCNTNPCCNNPCDDNCGRKKIPTSDICYDGQDLNYLCVKNGMGLNQVLYKIDAAIQKLEQANGEVFVEVSNNLVMTNDRLGIKLRKLPYRILFVWYCGSVVPTNAYSVTSQCVVLNQEFCFSDGNQMGVVYVAQVETNC